MSCHNATGVTAQYIRNLHEKISDIRSIASYPPIVQNYEKTSNLHTIIECIKIFFSGR